MSESVKGTHAVVGVFEYLDDTVKAIEMAKAEERDYRVYSPVPRHELEEVTYPEKSPVRRFTLIGGLAGLCFGFFLAIWCSLDWPLRVSAKDIVSIPGFVVVGYECTILFGAIATLLGLFHLCRIPDLLRKIGYDPRFMVDRFGVVVSCMHAEVDHIKQQLLAAGAEEVQVKDGL